MCEAKPDKKSPPFLKAVATAALAGSNAVDDGGGGFRWISAVKAPVGCGDGLRLSSSSATIELARAGDPVTDMLSFSKPSSTLLLLSLSSASVGGGVICEELVSDIFGEPFGLVVLCGLHKLFWLSWLSGEVPVKRFLFLDFVVDMVSECYLTIR